MLENILTVRRMSAKAKISVKTVLSVVLIALAVWLPQIVHVAAGVQGGATWLPMYLPVLLGACLLGAWWGLGIGVSAPLVSFALTALMGNAMPAFERLPFMVAELAVFAVVAGAFSGHISRNALFAFPAVLCAQIAGRCVFLALVAIFANVTSLTVQGVWAQICTGAIGLVAQAIIVPAVVLAVSLLNERKN